MYLLDKVARVLNLVLAQTLADVHDNMFLCWLGHETCRLTPWGVGGGVYMYHNTVFSLAAGLNPAASKNAYAGLCSTCISTTQGRIVSKVMM